MTTLSPTERTRLSRHSERARTERTELLDVLDAALICHLGFVLGGQPLVLPTVFATDVAGPDPGGSLYVHGSVAARSLVAAPDSEVCVTVTLVDGLVLARSAFNHSMNYRSAVIIGRARLVTDPAERGHALDLIVDHVVPDRSRSLREHTRKELAATAVVAVPLQEASLKVRSGGPVDEPDDVAAGGWAGVLQLRVTAGAVQPVPEAAALPVPPDEAARAADLR